MKRPRVLLLNLSGRMPLHKQNGCTVLSTSVFFYQGPSSAFDFSRAKNFPKEKSFHV